MRDAKTGDHAQEAAASILDLLGRAVRVARDARAAGSRADDGIHDICNEIDGNATLLTDPVLRDWVWKMTLVLWHVDFLSHEPVGKEVSIPNIVLISGQQLLGAFRRLEPLPPPTMQTTKLDELWAAAEGMEQLIERSTGNPSMTKDRMHSDKTDPGPSG